jgi:hypothetical protein
MQLYAGSSQQFIDDAVENRIGEKLRLAFFEHFRYVPPESEVRSWQNSLRAMCNVLQYVGLRDQGVALEYQLPLSSKRLDFMITGRDGTTDPRAVIVELKQWDAVQASSVAGCVTTYVGQRLRDVLHPSVQVGQYAQYLLDCQTAFSSHDVGLDACSYAHNFQYDPASEFYSAKHHDALAAYPLFAGDQTKQLAEYVEQRVRGGDGQAVLAQVLDSNTGPVRSC